MAYVGSIGLMPELIGYVAFVPIDHTVYGVCVGYDSTSMDGFRNDVYGSSADSGLCYASGVNLVSTEQILSDSSDAVSDNAISLSLVTADSAVAGALSAEELIWFLADHIYGRGAIYSNSNTSTALNESVFASGLVVAVVEQLIAEAADGSEAWFLGSASTLLDVLRASGIFASNSALTNLVAEVIVAVELNRSGGLATISESAEADESLANLLRATQAVLDNIIAQDLSTSYLLLVNTIGEYSQASEAVSIWQSLTQAIEEGSTAFVHLSIGGETYTGWVMNTSNTAVSEYQGLNFNSMCKIGNRYFGASDTGIHEITGNDDEGTSIATYVQSGLIDFGTAIEKTVPVAYLGADVDGRVAFGVSVSEKAGVSTYWYEANRELEAINNVKVPIGKGLSGRYWKFGIASDALSEFDAVTVIPVTLKRRV